MRSRTSNIYFHGSSALLGRHQRLSDALRQTGPSELIQDIGAAPCKRGWEPCSIPIPYNGLTRSDMSQKRKRLKDHCQLLNVAPWPLAFVDAHTDIHYANRVRLTSYDQPGDLVGTVDRRCLCPGPTKRRYRLGSRLWKYIHRKLLGRRHGRVWTLDLKVGCWRELCERR